MIMTAPSAELRRFSHGIAWRYIEINSSERSETGTYGTCQILSGLTFGLHRDPQDVSDFLLHGLAIRCSSDTQLLLDPLIQVPHCDAGQS